MTKNSRQSYRELSIKQELSKELFKRCRRQPKKRCVASSYPPFRAMSGLRGRRGQQEAPEGDLFFGRTPLVQGSPSTFDDKSTPGRSVYGTGLHSGYIRSGAAGLTPGMPTPRSTSKPPTRYGATENTHDTTRPHHHTPQFLMSQLLHVW